MSEARFGYWPAMAWVSAMPRQAVAAPFGVAVVHKPVGFGDLPAHRPVGHGVGEVGYLMADVAGFGVGGQVQVGAFDVEVAEVSQSFSTGCMSLYTSGTLLWAGALASRGLDTASMHSPLMPMLPRFSWQNSRQPLIPCCRLRPSA